MLEEQKWKRRNINPIDIATPPNLIKNDYEPKQPKVKQIPS